MYYTGLDIHCKHFDMTVIDEKEKVAKRYHFDTTAQNLICIMKKLPKPSRLALEESNIAEWVYRTIKPFVTEVIVCNPRHNNWIAKSPHKNDKVDSEKLAMLLKGNYLTPVHHTDDPQRSSFKRIVIYYHKQMKQIVRIKNSIKSSYRFFGVQYGDANVYGTDARQEWLDQVHATVDKMQLVDLYEKMDLYLRKQEGIQKVLWKARRKYPEIKLLMTIPGVGLITACTFVAIIDTPHRFADTKKLWSYCGIGMVNRESDGSKEPRRLNSSCNKLLKYVMKLAPIDATRSDNQFSRKYKKLVERNLDKSLARLSVARSICATMYSILKSGKEFELRTEEQALQRQGGKDALVSYGTTSMFFAQMSLTDN